MSDHDADTVAPPQHARLSRRVVVVALLLAILVVVGALVAIQVLFVNRIPVLTESTLEQAEELWERVGPASYDMDLEIRGSRPGRVHIEVRNSEVTTMSRDGRAPPERTWDDWSVPGQFATIERELQIAEDPEHEMQATQGTQLFLRCEFDPQYGFPRQFHRHVSGGGPEVYWRVDGFTPQ